MHRIWYKRHTLNAFVLTPALVQTEIRINGIQDISRPSPLFSFKIEPLRKISIQDIPILTTFLRNKFYNYNYTAEKYPGNPPLDHPLDVLPRHLLPCLHQ